MIAKIWYIKLIVGLPDEYIYRNFDIPYVLPDKTTIHDEHGQDYLFEEPVYNEAEGRLEILQDTIEYSEIGSYEAIGWIHYQPEEE